MVRVKISDANILSAGERTQQEASGAFRKSTLFGMYAHCLGCGRMGELRL